MMSAEDADAADIFLRTQNKLERKILQTRNPVTGLYNEKSTVPQLEALLREAEEQFEAFPTVDNNRPTIQYLQAALARERDGVPGEYPSEIKVKAFVNLKLARDSLAGALMSAGHYEEAADLYKRVVDQAQEMRTEIWEPESMKIIAMNSVGYCYRQYGKHDQALHWYKQALDLCQREGFADSDLAEAIQNNITAMLGHNAGAVYRGSSSIRVCWNCKKRDMVGDDGFVTRQLKNCLLCVNLKVTSPACYCSAQCQKIDWKNRHKEWHQKFKEEKEEHEKDNFSFVCKEASEMVLNEQFDGMDYKALMAQGVQAMENQDNERAAKLWKKAIEVQPDDCANAHHNLAIVYYASKNYNDAVKHYTRCMEVAENKGDDGNEMLWARSAASMFGMLTRFGECAVLEKPEWMQDQEQLKRVAMKVVRIVPDFTESWFLQGYVHQQANRRREAMQSYGKAASLAETTGAKQTFLRWKEDVLKNETS
jgi:tetratricopeptide (TPR) repeat protein